MYSYIYIKDYFVAVLKTLLFLYDFERFDVDIEQNPFTLLEPHPSQTIDGDMVLSFCDYYLLKLTPISDSDQIRKMKEKLNKEIGERLIEFCEPPSEA